MNGMNKFKAHKECDESWSKIINNYCMQHKDCILIRYQAAHKEYEES